MNRFLVGLLVIISTTLYSNAQQQDPSWSARRAIIDKKCVEGDSLCNVLHKLGTFEGHIRSFFMATTNHKDYPDYYALATGGGLGYYSPIIKNFQVGMSGFIIYNNASSHLGPQPPFSNRYEIGLFDVAHPDNHQDLDRLENLYARYYFSQEKHSYLQFGKFHLKTPLINLQDGRMRPNLQEGLWAEWSNWKKIKLKGGWLWRTSPRSTIQWFTIGESIGIYPNGRSVNGTKATYAGNVKTSGIAIGNIGINPVKGLDVQAWNYYVPQLFNTFLPKVEWKRKQGQIQWLAGVQYVWQQSLYNDTLSIQKQYISKNEQSHTFSTRLSRTDLSQGDEWSINYTRITNKGRFLFPREWGVESFYTFMYRERMEGSGDVHAVMIQNQRPLDTSKKLSLQSQAGIFWMPSVNNSSLNKYAMPSFYQANLRARYKFTGFFQGLQADVLYVYKGNLQKDLEESPVYYHNKVDIHHLSVVVDYYF